MLEKARVITLAESAPDQIRRYGISLRVYTAAAVIQSARSNLAPEPRYATDADIVGNRRLLLERVPHGATVLDVGCWSGSTGRFLQLHRQATVDGVEPDPGMAATAAQRYREVFATSVEQVLPKLSRDRSASYDAVMFLDVLEHLRDPDSVLRVVRGLVRQGGVALISLPNVAHWRVRLSLLRGRWRYRDNGILDRTHLRFFTEETARQLIEDAGWLVRWQRTSVQGLPIAGLEQSRIWEKWPRLFGVQFLFEVVNTAGASPP